MDQELDREELPLDRDQARNFARWFVWWLAGPEHPDTMRSQSVYRGLAYEFEDWSRHPEVPDALDALAANHNLARLLEQYRGHAVRAARRAGATWTEIGHPLGLDPADAQERYGRMVSRHLDGDAFELRPGGDSGGRELD